MKFKVDKDSVTYELFIVTSTGGAMLFATNTDLPTLVEQARAANKWFIVKETREVLKEISGSWNPRKEEV